MKQVRFLCLSSNVKDIVDLSRVDLYIMHLLKMFKLQTKQVLLFPCEHAQFYTRRVVI